MKIKPIGDRILVERERSEEKTAGGIVLPDAAKEKPQIGLVLSVGPGKTMKDGRVQPLQIKAGDRVYFTSWAGDERKADGKNLLLLREDDVLAVIE